MRGNYLSLFIYVCLIALFTAFNLLLSGLFRPKKGDKVKYLPYESGIVTEAHLFSERFTLHHYMVALVFLIFDIEVIFLFPWAVVAKSLGLFSFFEMLFFFAALLTGFFYVWKKGGLQWQ